MAAAPGSSTSTSTGEHWDWRKILDHDDIHYGHLTVPLDEFEEHILPKMTQDDQDTLRSRLSLNVAVVDVGRERVQSSQLLLMKFSSGNPPHYYRFGENWRYDFVRAGGLREGFPIALRCVDYGNNNKKRFEFTAFPNIGGGNTNEPGSVEKKMEELPERKSPPPTQPNPAQP